MSAGHRTTSFTFPCCEDGIDANGLEHRPPRVRLRVHPLLPREVYERTCPLCRSRWRIERRTSEPQEGLLIDLTEWTELRARLGDGTFRINHTYD